MDTVIIAIGILVIIEIVFVSINKKLLNFIEN